MAYYRKYAFRSRGRTRRRTYAPKRKSVARRTVRRTKVRMPKAAYKSASIARAKGSSQDTLLMKNLVKVLLLDKVVKTKQMPVSSTPSAISEEFADVDTSHSSNN